MAGVDCVSDPDSEIIGTWSQTQHIQGQGLISTVEDERRLSTEQVGRIRSRSRLEVVNATLKDAERGENRVKREVASGRGLSRLVGKEIVLERQKGIPSSNRERNQNPRTILIADRLPEEVV